MSDPFEAIRAHVEKNAGKERATFSIAGVKALLDAVDAPTATPLSPDGRRDAWASLRMVADVVGELFGPRASIESEEASLLRGPEYHHLAQGIVEALQRAAARPPIATSGTVVISDAMIEAGARKLCRLDGYDPDGAKLFGSKVKTWEAYAKTSEAVLNAALALSVHTGEGEAQ